MKYIILNDLKEVKINYKKYILLYFLLPLCFLIVQSINKTDFNDTLFIDVIGLNLSIKLNLLSLVLFLFYICWHLFVTLKLFVNDFKNGWENIFLRIDLTKWINYKLFSLFLVNGIFLIISNLSIFFYFFIKGSLISYGIIYIIINLLIKMVIIFLFIFIYLCSKKFPLIIAIFILVLFFLLSTINLNINLIIENFILVILCLICLILLINLIMKKAVINLAE